MQILVTGGAGFIGSHTCVELLQAGHQVVVIDNLCNSSAEAVRRVEQITGKSLAFYPISLLDENDVEDVFSRHEIDCVIHFAGLKAVGESVEKPLEYYHNNLTGTFLLLEAMRRHGVKDLVFSSSATVYGRPEMLPLTENARLGPVTNPYGRTKLILEDVFRDLCHADGSWRVILLRYFNPVGAHESGLIGEDPNGIPNNLAPYIAKVAFGQFPFVRVFGDDYDTPDGTGVRDYIHVVDLARGHVKAIDKLAEDRAAGRGGVRTYNLGTGVGYSVLDFIHAFSKVCGRELPYQILPRRAGDVDACYADPSLAKKELGWSAEYDLERMCRDLYRWQQQNPNGYKS